MFQQDSEKILLHHSLFVYVHFLLTTLRMTARLYSPPVDTRAQIHLYVYAPLFDTLAEQHTAAVYAGREATEIQAKKKSE